MLNSGCGTCQCKVWGILSFISFFQATFNGLKQNNSDIWSKKLKGELFMLLCTSWSYFLFKLPKTDWKIWSLFLFFHLHFQGMLLACSPAKITCLSYLIPLKLQNYLPKCDCQNLYSFCSPAGRDARYWLCFNAMALPWNWFWHINIALTSAKPEYHTIAQRGTADLSCLSSTHCTNWLLHSAGICRLPRVELDPLITANERVEKPPGTQYCAGSYPELLQSEFV